MEIISTFNKLLYQKAYKKAFNGISDAITLLETEQIITEINLHTVKALKTIQQECEAIFVDMSAPK